MNYSVFTFFLGHSNLCDDALNYIKTLQYEIADVYSRLAAKPQWLGLVFKRQMVRAT